MDRKDERAFAYLVGVGVAHSIAPPMHNYIAKSLGYDWNFLAQECPTVQVAVDLFREPTFAGGVVTMPYKTTIMGYLDGLDEHAIKIGACNNVYRAADGSLRGTNTDWRGVKGCLLGVTSQGKGKPGLIVGAGGASRAALFALYDQLQCDPIYVVNRDDKEVESLRHDAKVYGSTLSLIHIKTVEQARSLDPPFYIVGTVPDFEPKSPAEMAVRDILEHFLSSSAEKGVVLDMCFKPRRTRSLKLAERYGWSGVEGVGIIGHQIEEQYRLWLSEEESKRIDKQQAWAVLREAADQSSAINF